MIKRVLSLSLVAIVLTAAAFARATQTNASVTGSWDLTIDSPQGKRTVVLVIKQEGDKLTGVMKSPRGERPLDSVTVKGSDITFVMTAQAQGQEMVMTYKGKVDKQTMAGDADFGGFATGTWSAVPHKEEAASPPPAAGAPATAPPASVGAVNITGVWNFNVETPAGAGTPVFTLKQEGEALTGTYKGQLGEAPVIGSVKGSEVNFTIKVNVQGQDITVSYAGKIDGKDSMSGKASFGEMGEGTWSAKKKQ